MSKDASLSLDPATLPDDPALLKHFLVAERRERDALIAQIKAEAAQQLAAQAERQAAIDEAVKAAVAAILRRYYGPRSEKFDPRQLLLFGQVVEQLPLDEASIADEAGERHGVCPQRYLTSVLAKLPCTPAGELEQFLPDAWKAEDAAEPSPSVATQNAD